MLESARGCVKYRLNVTLGWGRGRGRMINFME